MVHLIDKDALVAEIEKRYEYWREKEHNSHSIESEIRMSECQHLMLLLNTLEVKEVELDEEIEAMYLQHDWNALRNQAAIAAMQGVMNFFGSIDYNRETIARLAVEQADALIEKLKEKSV